MRECKKQIITFASRDVGDRLAHVVTGPSQAGDVRLQLSHLHVLSGNTLQQDPAGRHMRQHKHFQLDVVNFPRHEIQISLICKCDCVTDRTAWEIFSLPLVKTKYSEC